MQTDSPTTTAAPAKPRASTGFDWLMACMMTWLIVGVFTDGWAHNHLDSSLETFFTPWHGVLYSGFAACALSLAVKAWRSRVPGKTWWKCLPDGYVPSLVGAGIFAFGGVFDLGWHTVFGIEADIEALLSPAHMFLAVGAFLIVSGPFRKFWRGTVAPKNMFDAGPLSISMAAMMAVISFMTQFAHIGRHFATGAAPISSVDHIEARAAAGMLLQMGFLIGMTLTAVRRWGKALPFGFFTKVFALHALLMALMVTDGYEFRLVPAGLAAGLLADWLSKKWNLSDERALKLRKFAVLVPFAYLLVFFAMLLTTSTVWWSIHMWLGTCVMAGVLGLLVSYVAVPMALPEAQK